MKLKNRNFFGLLFSLSALLFLSGCGVYSMTGANIDPNVKTISVQTFYDDSGFGPASLSQKFTGDLRDYFQQNTSLSQTQDDGDLQIEGSITGFRYSPVAAQATSNNNLNAGRSRAERLQITVKVKFTNRLDESQNFTKSFSQFAEYNLDEMEQSAAEPGLVEEITEKLVFDIFNNSVANW